MHFDAILTRADTSVLDALLGHETIRLLTTLDEKAVRPTVLRSLLCRFRSPQELLQSRSSRKEIIDLLSLAEARQLCSHLGISANPDPWTALKTRRPGASQLPLWFSFFELPTPPPEPRSFIAKRARVSSDYALFAHQRQVLRRLAPLLDRPPQRAILHMPTGSGKTRTAMHHICTHLKRTEPTVVFWLANSEELCLQAVNEFERAWTSLGNRSVDTYRLWGGNHMDTSELHDGFAVASLAKLYNAQMAQGTWLAYAGDRASLIVMDEAHQAIAPTYKLVLAALTSRYPPAALLGLTATPGRTWNDPQKDRELAAFFARNKVTLTVEGYDTPVDFLIDEGYLARPSYRTLEHPAADLTPQEFQNLSDSLEIPLQILRRLAASEQRTIKIIHEIESLATRHNRIIVFATTLNHADQIAVVLTARGLETRSITSRTPPHRRREAVAWYKSTSLETRVLTNYGVLTAGFDAPLTSAVVIARPTKSLVLYSQMVGRATRGPKAGGNSEAEILTVVDTNLPGFRSMAEAFRNWEDVW